MNYLPVTSLRFLMAEIRSLPFVIASPIPLGDQASISIRPPKRRFLFLTAWQWKTGLLISAVSGGLVMWFTAGISPWIGITVGSVTLVTYHFAHASPLMISLPHLAILIAALQYVFGPWASDRWPPNNPVYWIGERLPLYLSYAGPVMLAMIVGWGCAMVRLNPARRFKNAPTSRLLLELDVLFAAGIAAAVMRGFIPIPGLGFAFLLLSNLRYVSVFGRMLVQGPNWGSRLALVITAEVITATGSTMFHDLVLWSLWILVIWLYCFRPRPTVILALVAVGLIVLPALQQAKWQLREGDEPIGDEAVTSSGSSQRQIGAWLSYLIPALEQTITLNLDPDFIGDMVVRYNQGWIINRVMAYVPEATPYAEGETLNDALIAAVLPRVIAPNKVVAGGREKMLRYAGIELGEGTSMNLGYAGEMYANFGLAGGVIGCGMYAFSFGMIFRLIARRAFYEPLWWSIVPFLFYGVLKSEDDVAFVLNYTTKGVIVLVAISFFLPAFRRKLLERVH